MVGARRCGFLIACAAAVSAGCGGGDEGPREAYLRAANDLCAGSERRAGAIPEPRTADDFLPFLRRGLELSQREQRRLERLAPPASLRGYHDRSVERGDDLIAEFETVVERAEDGADPVAAFEGLLPELARVAEEGNREARRLGLEDCIVELPAPGAPPPSES